VLKNEIKYRLGDFIIIEHRGVLLTWVTHIALGAQRSGRCFIVGNILVIGHLDREEAGHLKLEFHEHLMKLPAWNKTRYYCFASSLRKVGSKQSLASYLEAPSLIDKIGMESVNITLPGTFRLDRYKITVGENSIVSWQTIGDLNRTIGGTCFIESGILFIGPKENELDEGQSRKMFFNELKLLPQWDKTFAWGHYGSLRICKESKPRKSYKAIWKPEHVKTYITTNMPFLQGQERRKEKRSESKVSVSEWLKKAWHRMIGWKVWRRLTNLILAGIFFGLRIFMFIIEKIAFLSHRIIEHFRKYRSKL
jgi:hypothetical protein